jgi:hypothetical protein
MVTESNIKYVKFRKKVQKIVEDQSQKWKIWEQ